MHPILSSGKSLLAVGSIWLALCFLISLFLQKQLGIPRLHLYAISVPLLFIYLFFCLSNYFICLRFPIGEGRLALLFGIHFSALVVSLALWLLSGKLWTTVLSSTFDQVHSVDWSLIYKKSAISLVEVGTLLYGFWILAHYIYLMEEKSQRDERESLQHRLLLSQTELQAVKETIHPHFLYNSLGTVANLTLSDPKKAHQLCHSIADFLRYSIGHSKMTRVSIANELEHIQNYLSVEKERFGERLQTDFQVDKNSQCVEIIPLILFPLIENAVKHGIGSCIEGGCITLSIKHLQPGLEISVVNPFDPLSKKPPGTKLGLACLRKRLQASYSSPISLTADSQKNQFTVVLNIPEGDDLTGQAL